MAINKSFVIKNGVQVSTDLIIGDADNNKVGIGTTIPGYDLHVGRGRKSRGGIGATDLVVTGVATVTNLNVTGLSTFAGALNVDGTVDFSKDVVFNGTNDITYDQSESALVFNDGAAIRVGTSSDFSISHDGSNTILRENGTGDLKILSSRIQLGHTRNPAVGDTSAIFTEGGAAELWFNSNKKFETVAIGATIFGDFIVAGVTTTQKLNVTGVATVGGALSLPDNTKAQFGTGGDLLIYHDSSNSYIDDQGTGDLIIRGSADIKLQSASGENYIIANDTGSVEAYFDNSKKVETTSGGLNVTGITTFSDRINVVSGVSTFQDNAKLTFGAQSDLIVYHSGSHSFIQDTTGTGNLYVDSNSLQIRNAAGDETQAVFTQDGSVDLYHNNVKQVETTADGILIGTGVTIQRAGGVSIAGITTIGGDLTVGGNSFFVGMVTFAGGTNGNITLGDNAGDNVVFNADVNSNVIPNTDNTYDLGSSSQQWKDIYINGVGYIDSLSADTAAISDLTDNRVVIVGSSGELEDDGNFTFDGTTLNVTGSITAGAGASVHSSTGNAAFAGIVTTGGALIVGAGATISGDILPDADGSRDLGSSTKEFQDLFIDGTANIDSLAADTAAIGDLTDNRVVIAGSSGELEDDANLTFDGAKLNVGSGVATVFVTTGNVAFAGIATVGGALLVGAGITVAGDILPDADGSRDLGSSTLEFQDLHLDGTANIDTLDVDGTSNFADDVVFAGAAANITFDQSTDDLIFDDNAKAVFGSSSDGLEIFHDSSDSFIIDQGTGRLNIRTNGDSIKLQNTDGGTEAMAVFNSNGSVQLYHNANERITTTDDGVDIGGTGSIRVPNGTTGERNSSPQAGDFRYNTTNGEFEGYTDSWGAIAGSGGGATEVDTSVSTTSATSTGSFAKASFRSASVIAQITQGSAYQVGRYLLIHDGTTVTTIEESAVATGSMLGTFEGVINGNNVEFRVTMGSSSSATVTTKIDTVTV